VKIVLLAEHALMNVRLKQYLKVTSIKLIRTCAPIAVLALMFVLLRRFIRLNKYCDLKKLRGLKSPFFIADYIWPSQEFPGH